MAVWRRWSEDELAALARGEQPEGRTAKACAEQRRKIGKRKRPAAASYSKLELSQRLGVNYNRVVYWRGKGWLIGIKSGERGEWRYARSAVRAFLIRRPEVIDRAKVDMAWLVEVLTGKSEKDRAG